MINNVSRLMKNNWQTKKLGDICTVIAGQSPESKYYNNLGHGLPFYQGKKEFKEKFIGAPSTWTTNTTKEACLDDILMSVRAPVGPVNFSTGRICIGRGLAAIRTTEIIDKEFLFNFLLKHENEMVGNIGAVFNSINKIQIENILIPTPPLHEQQRIVTILDKAFSAIASIKENAEKNIKNAREIFDSYLEKTISILYEHYEHVRLSDLATDITDGDHQPPPKSQTGIPFITISNIDKMTHKIDFSNTFTVSKEYFKKLKSNRKPQKNDVLYTVTGSFGIPVVIDFNLDFCFQRHIGLIRPTTESSPKWLYYLILSPQLLKQANDSATGTAQKTVSLKALRNFVVPRVPLSEQQRIIAQLDSISIETKKLESIYQKKLTLLDELKKSILQVAFSGELS